MTDDKFKEREHAATGHLDGIYVHEWSAMSGAKRATAADPKEARKKKKKKTGHKRQYGRSIQVLLGPTGPQREVVQEGAAEVKNRHVNKCWINALYDN